MEFFKKVFEFIFGAVLLWLSYETYYNGEGFKAAMIFIIPMGIALILSSMSEIISDFSDYVKYDFSLKKESEEERIERQRRYQEYVKREQAEKQKEEEQEKRLALAKQKQLEEENERKRKAEEEAREKAFWDSPAGQEVRAEQLKAEIKKRDRLNAMFMAEKMQELNKKSLDELKKMNGGE